MFYSTRTNLRILAIFYGLLISAYGTFAAAPWFLGRLSVQAFSSGLFCDNLPGLSSKQKNLCREQPDLMKSISLGVKVAIKECQHQFKNSRWNCTTLYNDGDPSFFANFMTRGSKEVAFVHAITSAGVAHTLARACSKGILKDCACDPSKKGYSKDSDGEFEWTGCSDNVKYGIKFSRDFLDAKDSTTRDPKGLMNLHNSGAGRRGVKKHTKLKCKCHGVSGSCSMRTCWHAMEDFAYIGDFLKRRYDRALLAEMNQDDTGLISIAKDRKSVRGTDIVYMENSPDYCSYNPTVGSIGTENRICNSTSTGQDGCGDMCCGSGYNTKTIQETVNCGCKFQWCCYVKCKQCTVIKDEHTCKGTFSIDVKSNTISRQRT